MKMRMLSFLLLAVVSLAACSKSNDVAAVNNSTPRTQVPDMMVGQWLNGNFAMSNWWTYDGKNYLGNPYTRSTAFSFSKNGNAEFFQVIKTFNGSCSTEGFTYMKGTVTFNEGENSFTFYAQSGTYRGFYSCAAGSNFNRPANRDELMQSTFYYDREVLNGREYMVIRFSPDASQQGTYFTPTAW